MAEYPVGAFDMSAIGKDTVIELTAKALQKIKRGKCFATAALQSRCVV